VDF
jgi:hypothetical protein